MNYVILTSSLIICFAIIQLIQNVYLLRLRDPKVKKVGTLGVILSASIAGISLIILFFSIFIHKHGVNLQHEAFPAYTYSVE